LCQRISCGKTRIGPSAPLNSWAQASSPGAFPRNDQRVHLFGRHHASEDTMHTNEMTACIEACQRCSAACLQTAMHHCLEVGGKHTEPKHFRLMMACVEVCRTSAALMMIGSPSHLMQCDLCARICEECATDCERIGGMQECVQACRACAEECRQM